MTTKTIIYDGHEFEVPTKRMGQWVKYSSDIYFGSLAERFITDVIEHNLKQDMTLNLNTRGTLKG